jgi:hypothetical protein
MQGEEEELQMQPDNVNTIQRTLEDEIKAEIASRRTKAGSRKKRNKGMQDFVATTDKSIQDKSLDKFSLVRAKQSSEKANFLSSKLSTKRESMGIGSKKNLGKLETLDKNRDKKDAKRIKAQDKEEKQQQKETSRNKLMQVIQNPKSSSKDVAAAEEKLNMLHKRSKSDKFKSFFTPGKSTKEYSEQAKSQRGKSLQSLAERGDDEAFEALKSEKEAAKEKSQDTNKGGSGLLSAGKWAGGKALGFAKGKLNEGVNHFLGTKDKPTSEKKEEKKPEAPAAPSGGGGISAIMEQYAEVLQENKKLKEQLAGLKGSK